MACSICGDKGHNARTCPQLLPTHNEQTNQNDDFALWLRYGGLTKDQTKELKAAIEEAIEQIAPESYGVIAAGRASKLPQRIQEAIKQVQPLRLENKEK